MKNKLKKRGGVMPGPNWIWVIIIFFGTPIFWLYQKLIGLWLWAKKTFEGFGGGGD